MSAIPIGMPGDAPGGWGTVARGACAVASAHGRATAAPADAIRAPSRSAPGTRHRDARPRHTMRNRVLPAYFTHYSGFQFAFSVLPLIERVQVSLLIGLGLIRQGRADVMLMDAPLEGIVWL